MEKVNIAQKFSLFHDYCNPRVAGELNGQQIRLVKFIGTFAWHHHKNEDELFLVIKGKLKIEFRDHLVELRAGEFLIVPRGIEHRTVSEKEVHLLLFEPASTINTGNIQNKVTVIEPSKI